MCVIDKCLLLADLAEWTDAHVADDDLDPLALAFVPSFLNFIRRFAHRNISRKSLCLLL